MQFYIGTYTRGSGGIHLADLDADSGALTYRGLAAECASPSFLAIGPGARFVYAVNEIGDYQGAQTGSVTSFARDAATGKLTHLNTVSSQGSYPCHISLDRTGKFALVANYGGGTVSVVPIRPDGSLGDVSCMFQHVGSSINKARQEGPHAHSVNLDRSGAFALACDLGTDQVLVYRFDAAEGRLSPNDPPAAAAKPGAGPRHLAFSPNGRTAYVINELDSTIVTYRFDGRRGTLEPIGSVPTLPAGFGGQSTTAEVAVHPSGRWVYGSNRGHDSLVVCAVNPASGALRVAAHVPTGGKTPRNFVIDPKGRWIVAANQDSSEIISLSVDQRTGVPAPVGQPMAAPLPVCVRFVPG